MKENRTEGDAGACRRYDADRTEALLLAVTATEPLESERHSGVGFN